MNPDPSADMFRFRIGQPVRWSEYPHERYFVGQRRWTEREVVAPLVEYRLRMRESGGPMLSWVPDHELLPWKERA